MNKSLEKDIRLKLLYFNNEIITEEDLKKIIELGLNNFTLSNKPKNIDLTELSMFPNIVDLTLQNFQIGEDNLETLSNLSQLKRLQIVSCEICSEKTYQFPTLEDLIISTSKFSDLSSIVLPRCVTINGINSVIDLCSIQGIQNVENLRLTNIKKVCNFGTISQMINLKSLNLDGTKVDNKKILKELENRIPISQKSESHMIR